MHPLRPHILQNSTLRARARGLILPMALTVCTMSPVIAQTADKPDEGAPLVPSATASKTFCGKVEKIIKPTLATAKEAFNKRDFHSALEQFTALHKQGLCNETVHYYIARCYQQMAQVAPALQNYEIVITRGKDERIRSYATTAYIQLSKYSHHRTYEGQGNNFLRSRPGPASGGGGGGGG